MNIGWHQTINLNSGAKNNITRLIRISPNNWVGFNCVILKGTETPDFCIVSSNSLLNNRYENLPINTLLAGSPAKLKIGSIVRYD